MLKLVRYLLRNSLHIVGTFLLAVFFILSLCPVLLKHEIAKKILGYNQYELVFAITALVGYILIARWQYTVRLWKRYRNTYTLNKLSFLYPDYVITFLIFVGLLTKKCYASWGIEISSQMRNFLVLNTSIFLLWVLGSYSWPKVWLLGTYFWPNLRRKPENVEYDKYSLSDEPITEEGQDLLGRDKFINSLYDELVKLPFQDSFVFGIYGGWGEGKTSALNLLKKKILNNDIFVLVDFKPWYFRDEEAILNAFYQEVEHAITENFLLPDLRRVFSRYRKILTSGIEHKGIKIGFNFDEESVDDMKQRIESYILQIAKKIVIFVDDIDRLPPDEILLIFNLVRHNSKFKSTIFILSFDENYVTNILENRWSTRGHINNQEVDLVHIKKDYVC